METMTRPHVGHQVNRGLRAWQKVHAESLRNRKTFFKTKEAWARFKQTSGIHGSLTIGGALEKLRKDGAAKSLNRRTLNNWVNGLTDVKLSTAIDVCAVWGCSVDDFARAMMDAWEVAERRWATEEAMREALIREA